jgi:hypothetical protein
LYYAVVRNLQTNVEVLLASFAINLLALALPLAMLQVYDRILGSSGWGTAVALLGWVAVAIVLEVFCRFGRSVLLSNRAAEFQLNAQVAGLQKLLRTDFRAIEAKGSSRLPGLLEAPAKLQDLYSGQGYVALYDLPFAIIFLGLVFYIGGDIALIPLSVLVLVVIFAAVSGADFPEKTERFERLDASRNWMLSRYFDAMEGVPAMGMESLLTGIVRSVTRARMDLQEAMERKSLLLTEASMFLGVDGSGMFGRKHGAATSREGPQRLREDAPWRPSRDEDGPVGMEPTTFPGVVRGFLDEPEDGSNGKTLHQWPLHPPALASEQDADRSALGRGHTLAPPPCRPSTLKRAGPRIGAL